jgi:hypothetical protein
MKKMKKQITYAIMLATVLSLVFAGCSKQLEENPVAQFTISSLNANTLNALVTGAYEPLARSRGRLWESRLTVELESMSEYAFTEPGDVLINTYVSLNTKVANPGFDPIWTTFYQAIGRSNLLLKAIEDDKGMTDASKQVAKGEALFIRSLCYFWVVRIWGPVPLRLTPISGSSDVNLAVSDINAIYTQIIADLKLAETYLPAKVSAANAGRATAGAAKMMLADIYLNLKDYTNAKAKAKEVIDNKSAYGYDLLSNFETLYSPTAATNSEDVFSIKFDQIAGYGFFVPAYAADSRAKDAGLAARGLFVLGTRKTVPLIAGWDTQDLRRDYNLYNMVTIKGIKVPAILTHGNDYFWGKYKDPNAADEVGAGNDFYLYRYAEALMIFAEAENQLNGPTADAYNAINQVRRRGYGLPTTTASVLADLPAGLTKTVFDDMVFRERGYEFFFEVKRWFDMERTGRTAAYTAAAGKVVPTEHYYQIPDVEKQNNKAIK